MKCIDCSKKSTYSNPKHYCTYHWLCWWYGGLATVVKKNNGQVDWKKILKYELEQAAEDIDKLYKAKSIVRKLRAQLREVVAKKGLKSK